MNLSGAIGGRSGRVLRVSIMARLASYKGLGTILIERDGLYRGYFAPNLTKIFWGGAIWPIKRQKTRWRVISTGLREKMVFTFRLR